MIGQSQLQMLGGIYKYVWVNQRVVATVLEAGYQKVGEGQLKNLARARDSVIERGPTRPSVLVSGPPVGSAWHLPDDASPPSPPDPRLRTPVAT